MSTEHNKSVPASQFLGKNQDIATLIADYLSVKEVSRLLQVSKCFSQFFQPGFNKRTAGILVVEGNIISLKKLIGQNGSLLFEKHKVIVAPRGQMYFNVSYFQLIIFLCDHDMKTQVMGLGSVVTWLENPDNAVIYLEQYREIACGGADLIRLDRDPQMIVKEEGFKGLIYYETTCSSFLTVNTLHNFRFRLLGNPDGIICYQNGKEQRFYYVNQKKETVELLDSYIISRENEEAFRQFKAAFEAMENNSGRRSSLNEHSLIKEVFRHSLVQEGILYKHNGISYRDYRTPFNLVNAYRKCIRLYKDNDDESGRKCWINEVQKAHGEEIWLFQEVSSGKHHILSCRENEKHIRDSSDCWWNEGGVDTLFSKGVIKAHSTLGAGMNIVGQLASICRLIENAETNVTGFGIRSSLALTALSSGSNGV